MVQVPEIFRQKIRVNYPAHQRGDLIEEFAEKFFADKIVNGYEYLPIHWCAWHVNHGYGREKEALRRWVLDHLPKGKWFTTVQYDGGTLIDDTLDELGVLRFNCDGETLAKRNGPNDIWIPLLCDPHPVYREKYEDCKWLASFVGSFDTHPIRRIMKEIYHKREGYYLGRADTNLFRNVMRDSVFCLCPRGSGVTSFRMYEAIQCGVIPVYISDYFALPFQNKINWDDLIIKVKIPGPEIDHIDEKLKNISKERIIFMQKYGNECYNRYMTMKGVCEEILNILEVR